MVAAISHVNQKRSYLAITKCPGVNLAVDGPTEHKRTLLYMVYID